MANSFKNLKLALSDMLSPLSEASVSRRSSRRNSAILEAYEEILDNSLDLENSKISSRRSSRLNNSIKSKENIEITNSHQKENEINL